MRRIILGGQIGVSRMDWKSRKDSRVRPTLLAEAQALALEYAHRPAAVHSGSMGKASGHVCMMSSSTKPKQTAQFSQPE